ncbi:MAG: hypothetical protein QGD94_05630, partial [Planctomycetia bacterium]|nr:hypothetical protein [Planctomycetia bacterium]
MHRTLAKIGVLSLLLYVQSVSAAAVPPEDVARGVIRWIPDWPGVRVEIPLDVYRVYQQDLIAPAGKEPKRPPLAHMSESAVYRFEIEGDHVQVGVQILLRILDAEKSRNLRLLTESVAWEDVRVDGEAPRPGTIFTRNGWLCFRPSENGPYAVTAKVTLKAGRLRGLRRITLPIAASCRLIGEVASDEVWDVSFARSPFKITGQPGKGTRGRLGIVPGKSIEMTYGEVRPPRKREPLLAAAADVAWDLAVDTHHVRARVEVTIWGGRAELLYLDLPPGAERVNVTGADVREFRTEGGRGVIHLRGPIQGRTILNLSFDTPRKKATGRQGLPRFAIRGARWRAGTLVIGNSRGSSEVLEQEVRGLEGIAFYDIPKSARGLLPTPPVLAYRITGGRWNAAVDVVDVTALAMRETIVDRAHYTVVRRPDGSVLAKVVYEVRNRNRQFVTLRLPKGAEPVLVRVSERPATITPLGDGPYLIRLDRSVATIGGLVS